MRVRFLMMAVVSLVVWTQALVTCAADFEKQVKPILVRRCVACHGPQEASGNVRLDTLSIDLINDSAAAETWHDVLNVLNRGEMPPEDEPQLTKKERDVLAGWVTEQILHAVRVRRSTGGQVVIRRLNRVEYRNTMRDLLGIDLNYGRNLPPDTPGDDGFLNNGAALNMSALQIEAYLESARNALKRAIVTYDEPSVADASQTEPVTDKVKQNYTNTLGRSGVFVLRSKEFPDEGEFLIRIRARAVLPGDAPYPQMKVVLGYRADTQTPSEVVGVQEVSNTEFQEFEFRGRIEEFPRQSRTQSKYPGLLVWITNAFDDGKPPLKPRQEVVELSNAKGKTKKQKRTIYPVDPDFPKVEIESVSFKAPIFESWPPGHHTRILFDDPSRTSDEETYARLVLQRFMRRAFRRPATSDEVQEMVDFFKSVRPEFATFEETMRETLAMVLISPEFLYLIEPSSDRSRPLTDHEFASRLSYFLWSSMPDDQLFALAGEGVLSEPDVLRQQVERMLADDKSQALVDNFASQWLNLRLLDSATPSKRVFPEFNGSLRKSMRRETELFFKAILDENRPIFEFLNADFTFVDEDLAKHYGIEGVKGKKFQRVSLKETQRSGVLTQASILTLTSDSGRTLPVNRGKWVLENIWGTPPPEPPANVPALDEVQKSHPKETLRQQLARHRSDPICASCHVVMDPIGLGFENFDAIGRWRDKEKKLPIDASGELPGSGPFSSPVELLRLIAQREDDFSRHLARTMLTYALGRGLEYYDKCAVDQILIGLKSDNYRFQSLIHEIVLSEPFLKRRGDGATQ